MIYEIIEEYATIGVIALVALMQEDAEHSGCDCTLNDFDPRNRSLSTTLKFEVHEVRETRGNSTVPMWNNVSGRYGKKARHCAPPPSIALDLIYRSMDRWGGAERSFNAKHFSQPIISMSN
ncbi:unnamed protein product [Acanthocheilonema viteae]|uniref:Uncharacterized protein n=1 Tax=Acanthocheilonema viteae TaxID=6277 RepID=A0A498SWY9_ACAVI|nr:unnamed protein product [Acanthocheilonema viteae]